MILISLLLSFVFSLEPLSTKPAVQIFVEKQSIQSIALHRLEHWYHVPLYVRLPKNTERGTGWFLDSQTIVTNHHVIAGAIALGIEWNKGEILPATIVGRIPELDIAVLRLETPVPLEEQWTYASNLAIDETIQMGGFGEAGLWDQQQAKVVSRGQIGVLQDEKQSFLVLDQKVTPGFSGGPAWNQHGKLVGMVTAIDDQYTYVLPIEQIVQIESLLLHNELPDWGMLGMVLDGRKIVWTNPDGPAKELPLGTIDSVRQGTITEEKEIKAALRRLSSGEKMTLTVDGAQYEVVAQSISKWSSSTGECMWRGASLQRVDEQWIVQQMKQDSPLYAMGIMPADQLLLEESCAGLQRDTTLRIIAVQRAKQRFTAIVPLGIGTE